MEKKGKGRPKGRTKKTKTKPGKQEENKENKRATPTIVCNPSDYVMPVRDSRKRALTRRERMIQGLSEPVTDDMFFIKEVEGKGRVVFLKLPIILKDAYVMEYEGDCITRREAHLREKVYSQNNEGSYCVDFTFNNIRLTVDGTRKYRCFSRYLNHSRRPNVQIHAPIVKDFESGKP